MKKIISKYPEVIKENSFNFRKDTMYSRVLFSYEMAFEENCKSITYNYNISRIKKIIVLLFHKNFYFNVEHQDKRDNINKKLFLIRFYNPICFCLNDLTPKSAEIALKYLKKRFSIKSICEK